MSKLAQWLTIILQSVNLEHGRLLKVKLVCCCRWSLKTCKTKNTVIYIFHQHEEYVHSYIIQLLVIHLYNRLKFKISTHISILNLVALNYSIEIFVEIWPTFIISTHWYNEEGHLYDSIIHLKDVKVDSLQRHVCTHHH